MIDKDAHKVLDEYLNGCARFTFEVQKPIFQMLGIKVPEAVDTYDRLASVADLMKSASNPLLGIFRMQSAEGKRIEAAFRNEPFWKHLYGQKDLMKDLAEKSDYQRTSELDISIKYLQTLETIYTNRTAYKFLKHL